MQNVKFSIFINLFKNNGPNLHSKEILLVDQDFQKIKYLKHICKNTVTCVD